MELLFIFLLYFFRVCLFSFLFPFFFFSFSGGCPRVLCQVHGRIPSLHKWFCLWEFYHGDIVKFIRAIDLGFLGFQIFNFSKVAVFFMENYI